MSESIDLAIMNLPCNCPFTNETHANAYKAGHRDARHAAVDVANAALATRDARIRELEAALKPFAAMHREEYTKDEIVLMRGIEEDMTVLHSHDFANAAVVLAAKDKP